MRYRIKHQGLDKLNSSTLSKKGGILFLPNHPAEVDPIIVGSILWSRYQPRPMIVEWIIKLPVVSIVMKLMRAVPIPNFEDKSSQSKRIAAEKSFQAVVEGLKKNDNFMIYPAGRLKSSEHESLGGASGLFKIIQANPNANIVLVRTTGLWGSRFSRGWDGKRVVFLDAVLHALKALLKNGIFFMPRRRVFVELEPVNDTFPYGASRFELNRYLEEWYNSKKDPLQLVSYQFWSRKIKRKYTFEDPVIDLQHVSEKVQNEVVAEIARISKCLYSEIKPEMNLFVDLRLDSLDIQDLATFLETRYKVNKIKPCQLTTVASVMNYAADPENTTQNQTEKLTSSIHWKSFLQSEPIRATIRGETLPKAFVKIACERKKDLACADLVTREMSYERLLIGAVLLSKKIRKIQGDYVGVLLPACTTVNLVILACQIAKKIPVLINWTVGKKHLEAVLEQTKLTSVITSKAFLRNIEDVDLTPFDRKFLFAEDIKRSISSMDKLKAYFLVKMSCEHIIKALDINKISASDTAALIFTSGTETLPKGVPLSHENIISNLNSAFDRVETTNHDVVLGFLPPFHSFGLTVTGLLPLVSGVRVVYYPNPTHYKKIGRLIAHWQVTFLCGAPTFIKGILQPAHKEYFESLRIIVTGAEKAPASLLNRIEQVCPQAAFVEGYGLSECGPILTLNVPGKKCQGVGPALDIVDLLIVDPQTNQVLPQGEKGHVLAKGANIFSGYLGDSPSPFIELMGKKWFKTGDLGYLDDRNYLTLVGRLKRQVKIGGEMVNLNALEESLTQKFLEDQRIDASVVDQPNVAICAKEGDGRAMLTLFVTFEVSRDEANKEIKHLGYSNLHKVSQVIQLSSLPLMASGKIHYRELEKNL